MRALPFLVAGFLGAALGMGAGSDRVLCRKLEPPIHVALRLLDGAAAGELRVQVEVRSDVALTDTRMVVRLEDSARAASREETRGLALPAGELMRQELRLRGASQSGALLVGVEGRLGDAVFHRSAALELGPPVATTLAGTTRADAEGRTYFEVRGASLAEAEQESDAAAVAGTATYEDRTYTRNGFTGGKTRKPIRFATVQVVADDNQSVLATTATDASGRFGVSVGGSASRRVHVAIVAASNRSPYALQVVDRGGRMYALAGPSFAAGSSGAKNLTAAQADLGGVFNILDAGVRGTDTVRALQSGARFPALRFIWEKGSLDGTYYDEETGIHLLGERSDPDEYDDDVVLHEFGHYVANVFSLDTSRGGSHDPFDSRPEAPALAWSEGFATWFSSEARATPDYVDNSATGHSFFEIETPTARSVTRGEGNEIAIGAILWDIADPANESFDRISRKRSKLWDVTHDYFQDGRPASTLDVFCEGWLALGLGETSALSAIFSDRGASCP